MFCRAMLQIRDPVLVAPWIRNFLDFLDLGFWILDFGSWIPDHPRSLATVLWVKSTPTSILCPLSLSFLKFVTLKKVIQLIIFCPSLSCCWIRDQGWQETGSWIRINITYLQHCYQHSTVDVYSNSANNFHNFPFY
jgi:hypothetical protein